MSINAKIKLLQEYKWHLLFEERERQNNIYESITKEIPKVLVLRKKLNGKYLDVC